jgi:hypothetical protein
MGPLLVEADPVRAAELGLAEGRPAPPLIRAAATRNVPAVRSCESGGSRR